MSGILYKKWFVFFAVLMAFTIRISAQYEKHLFIYQGDTLPYKFLKPVQPENQKYPLVLFFHGAGERGRDNEIQTNHIDKLFLDSVNRIKYSCFLIAPQCPPDKKWVDMEWTKKSHTQNKQATTQMKLVKLLVDSLMKNSSVDSSRFYVTGLSMGGFGTYDFCARYGANVAAAMPVCGGYDTSKASVYKEIPFRIYHGAIDNVVPVENSRLMVKAMKKKKVKVNYVELPKVKHGAWKDAYKNPEVLEWLFSNQKK